LGLFMKVMAMVWTSVESGAGEGNRTLVSGLGSPHSTIEPHPHSSELLLI
jgi:hypothetical protein